MNIRNKQILDLALPSIISNITVPLLGMVDVAIVGHIGDAGYIASIAVGSMLFNVIYWLFGFLRMGTGGMTSQAYGSRDFNAVVRSFRRSLGIAMIIGISFIILQYPIVYLGMLAMKPDAEILDLCRQYCYIVIWGAPAVLGLFGMTGWYVGVQNTRIPMIVSISQNIINIIASLILVFGFHLEIVGVALGTIIAQWSGFLMAIFFWWKYYRRLNNYLSDKKMSTNYSLLTFFQVNRDIILRTLFLVSVFLFFTSAGSRQGAMVLAVNTIMMQFYTFFSYFSDGFAYAGEALGGRYYGAKNMDAFKDMVRRLLYIGGGVTTIFTLLYMIGGDAIIRILTNDEAVIAASQEYSWWLALIPVAGIAAFLYDGIFVGITNTKGMLTSSVIASICFFAVYLGLQTKMANHALWLAFIVYLVMRGLVEIIIYRRWISACR